MFGGFKINVYLCGIEIKTITNNLNRGQKYEKRRLH